MAKQVSEPDINGSQEEENRRGEWKNKVCDLRFFVATCEFVFKLVLFFFFFFLRSLRRCFPVVLYTLVTNSTFVVLSI